MEIATARNSHGQITGIPYDWFSDCHREATHRPGRTPVVRQFRSVFRKSPCRRAQRLFPCTHIGRAREAAGAPVADGAEFSEVQTHPLHPISFSRRVSCARRPPELGCLPHDARASGKRAPTSAFFCRAKRPVTGRQQHRFDPVPSCIRCIGFRQMHCPDCVIQRPATALARRTSVKPSKTKSPRSFLNVPHLAASFSACVRCYVLFSVVHSL